MSQRLRLDIPDESWDQLQDIAIAERRPLAWQAEVLLIKAIHEHHSPMLRPDVDDVDEATLIGKGPDNAA
jgi:hypothetical protein